ncbi:L-histidine N(alpha)-methyltransferase [Xanthomonas campestris pv. raphani]|uniref:L-histidine N(alpha)-methyltransferase n=1 Tax=Xanthomonas campestris TaxID=339 RepID=UPI000CDA5206|nr:L-histidine N(alpha)-methyltransferase [Xanthomonas campestris]MEA9752677.1 L-histidine N(alpha)-methyltransferase [Xanthomonas campestris pv. raphani]MEA9812057.1 L-histidine N(alpha)-methyltransferase [Xanthomonas campestris pv. raphani]TXD45397.1 L-histidine N(alpha)-methyltransferase [Xanthomonas campestris]
MNAAAHATQRAHAALTDLRPQPDDITADALAGLSQTPKTLPSKYFYDARGSQLFEAITRQPEYYLTTTELSLLEASMSSIAQAIGAGVHVVEYGSGSGRKTELLLQGLRDVVAYTPLEISRTALLESTARLAEQFPQIQMLPVCTDFTRPLQLPAAQRPARRHVVFFPGSTLGNFTDTAAIELLDAMRQTMGADGCALIGIDLDKDAALIEAAYNDGAGVTAEFTVNLLARLNREIGSDFDLEGFRHRAVYARERGRIETFLVSQRAQRVHVGGQEFTFAEGEAMQVEYSYKYTDARFAELAAAAGLKVTHGWNDAKDWFGLRLLRPL